MYRLYVVGLNAALFGKKLYKKTPSKAKREPILKGMDIRCKSVLYYCLCAVFKNKKIIYVFLKKESGQICSTSKLKLVFRFELNTARVMSQN